MHPTPQDGPGPAGPIPGDLSLLFSVLLAARVAGDRSLESLARERLIEAGVRVVFRATLFRRGGHRA